MHPARTTPWHDSVALGLDVAALYVVTGRVGLQLASYGETATLLWAPTGLALAAVVLGGRRMSPAVWLGAFLTNQHLPAVVAGSIATGNALEALVCAELLWRSGVDPSLPRVHDVLLFLLWSWAAPVVSATVATIALLQGGFEAAAVAPSLWLVWWAGDAVGMVTIAPAFLTWARTPGPLALWRYPVEGAGLLVLLALAAFAGFGTVGEISIAGAWAAFPLLVWAAVRFGTREATTAVAALSAAAIVGTSLGRGPFVLGDRAIPVAAWLDLCGMGVTTLLVAAIASERNRALEVLRAQAHELREADRRKDEFLALLGHELRNPLAAIAAGTRVLRLPQIGDDKRSWALDAVSRQLAQLTSLVNDLLDLTRISRGKIRLHVTRLGLVDAVRQASRTVEAEMAARRHGFHLELPEHEIEIEADATRLEQLLVNLLSNAAKYTPDGGQVTLAVTEHDDRVHVSVQDTGAGLGAEELGRVFEPFAQGLAGQGAGGLGLGLALVHDLAKLHGWDIVADSAGPGQGATFRLTLPVAADRPPVPEPQPAPARPRLTGLRVLVVDDNVDAARGLCMLLEEHGHVVRAAADGRTGLAEAASFSPQLALLDIGLPDMTGYDLARALRSRPSTRETVLVAVTGFGTPEARRRAREAGFTQVVVKPVDDEALLDLIDEVCAVS